MRMAQVLAGFTLAQADVLRKAVGKKDEELLRKEVGKFVEMAVAKGVDERNANEIAEQVVTFGRYGFNRSHSVAYALLSYQTAWLKRHYPAEFMSALLSSVEDKTDDVVHYIAECREMQRTIPDLPNGVQVLAPDINQSEWKFTPVAETEIRFGLGALRGVGVNAVNAILEQRQKGPFTSLFDLVDRVDLRVVGRRVLESLIQAGALDGFGHRAQLMAGLDLAIREAQIRAEERDSGQGNLFGEPSADSEHRPDPALPDVPRWPESERLTREKEVLGFFISGHPLEKYKDEVRLFSANTASLKQFKGQKVELPCVVTQVARQISKKNGAEWGRITVEDFFGTASVLAFGDVWEQNSDLIVQDAAILIRGQVSDRERDEEDPPIFLDGVTPLGMVRTNGQVGLEVRLSSDLPPDDLSAAADIFRRHPGAGAVFVRYVNGGENGTARLRSREFLVDMSDELIKDLRELLGAELVQLVRV